MMHKTDKIKTVVYDIETLINLFTYTDIDKDDVVTVFVIHESRNDFDALMEYLMEPLEQVGFNNERFDSLVLAYMFNERKRLSVLSPPEICRDIHRFVQRTINSDEPIYIKRLHPQIDLFLLNHFNNKARSTSLKALQCSMYWHNVQDMPFSHNRHIEASEIDLVLEYNLNDVLSTRRFFDLNEKALKVREVFSKTYRKDFTNKSDVAIGEEIFLHYIKKTSGLGRKELKEKVVHHKKVRLDHCVLPYIKYNSSEFNKLLFDVKNTIIGGGVRFKQSVRYKGFQIDFGEGGIHGCVPSGIYDTSGDKMIIDIDVKSYYPNLAIQNGFHPGHIPKDVFIETYKMIFDERVKKQKEGKDDEQAGLKLALNGVFGKTGEQTSPFHDKYYFYKITVNGQLLLAMLAEAFMDFLPGCEVLQINTDGLTIRIPKSSEEKCMQISEKFMQRTKLILEYAYYEKMIIADVNNYIAAYKDLDKSKKKGKFVTSREWHQNNSFMAIPKALEAYFVNGIPVEQTLKNNNNIYDFCGRYKATKGWHARYNTTKKVGDDTVFHYEDYGKILRYYPTTSSGGTAVKVCGDGRNVELLSGWATQVFNRFEDKPIEDYKIDYQFFIGKCNEIIHELEPTQLTLF